MRLTARSVKKNEMNHEVKIHLGLREVCGEEGQTPQPLSMSLSRLLETRALVQASSGGGKSWLLRRLIEQCWGKTHIVIIDPEGEFVTLAEKFEIIVAGQGGDVPLSVESAGQLAAAIMKEGASIVCDISEMSMDDRHEWVRNFIAGLVGLPQDLWHKTLVFIDEAHLFAPERGQGESPALGAICDLVSRGRKRGLCPVLATQRLGKLNKNVAAELLNLIIGSTIIDVDRERALGAMAVSRKDKDAFFAHLRSFKPGEFFALGPAFDGAARHKFKSGPVQTTHAREVGQAVAVSPRKLKGALAEIAAEIARASQAAQKESSTEAAGASGPSSEVTELREKVRVLEEQLSGAITAHGRSRDRLEAIKRVINAPDSEVLICGAQGPVAPEKVAAPVRPAPANSHPVKEVAHPKRVGVGPDSVGRCGMMILSVLRRAGAAGCNGEDAAVLSGYSFTGSFRNALSELRTRHFIEGGNTQAMTLTGAGQEALLLGGEEAPRGEKLWEMWLSKFGRAGRLILERVRSCDGQSAVQLARATEYEFTGSFRNSISELRTAGLIHGKNSAGIYLNKALRRELE